MALLSALLSFVGKKAGDLLQAILGWSVTALFGRLGSFKQNLFAGILVASLLWPVLVIGIFVPAVSSWAFTATPVHQWVGEDTVRGASAALGVVLPAVIGLVVRKVAPPRVLRGGVLRTAVAGYPLTVGFAMACLLTAVTVPVVKLVTILKRWEDEHVVVQPFPDQYDAALAELARACERAGHVPRVEDVPRFMTLGTRVLLWFARGALDALVPANPKRLRAADVEMFLYPGDLLLRGKSRDLARVRAAMNATGLVRTAYLVSEPAAQSIQDDIARMWDVIARHRSVDEIGGLARRRLGEIRGDLEQAPVTFDEWALLDREILRLERAMGGGLRLPVGPESALFGATPAVPKAVAG